MPEQEALPAKTTAEENRVSLGQRRVNIIWEVTQSTIAIAVTGTTLYVAAELSFKGADTAAFLLISNAFFLIVGFYFGRTNHQRVGGVGANSDTR